jgi:hypothetical protein
MRPIWYILIGAVAMFIFLKLLQKTMPTSATTKKLQALAKTNEAHQLIKTNEFRELVKTQEFLSFALTLAEDQMNILSTNMAYESINK